MWNLKLLDSYVSVLHVLEVDEIICDLSRTFVWWDKRIEDVYDDRVMLPLEQWAVRPVVSAGFSIQMVDEDCYSHFFRSVRVPKSVWLELERIKRTNRKVTDPRQLQALCAEMQLTMRGPAMNRKVQELLAEVAGVRDTFLAGRDAMLAKLPEWMTLPLANDNSRIGRLVSQL